MVKIKRITAVLLFTLVLLALFIGNTQPIQDGDTWWQMAYGRYMVENRSLIPDHTIYTWSPASGNEVYCAWISEIFFYAIYSWGGLAALYAVKYSVGFLAVLLVVLLAARRSVLTHPVTGLTALVVTLTYGSSSGSFLKPEMFSFLFMTVTVYLWWHIRALGDTAWWKVYFFPVIILLWVNSHGGFVVAAPFLALAFAGDLINNRFNPEEALAPRVRKHLIIAGAASIATLFMTPYGWLYPFQLIALAGGGQNLEQLKTVQAYGSPLDFPLYILYFGLPILVVSYAFAVSRKPLRPDWVFVLTNLAYGFIYTIYGRLIYYWAPVYAFSVVYLLANDRVLVPKVKRWVRATVMVFVLIVALDQVRWQAFKAIVDNPSWFGTGNSYANSPEETEFLFSHYKGHRIANTYDPGGYMLWRLGPETKIMIDPRFFPFRSWYDRYLQFQSGRDIEQFERDFPFDVILLQYKDFLLIPHYLRSPFWRPVFYGTGGVVFARSDILPQNTPITRGAGVFTCPSIAQSAAMLSFSLRIGDYIAANKIFRWMDGTFTWFTQRATVEACGKLIEGVELFFHRQYTQALDRFEKAAGKVPLDLEMLGALYHFRAVERWSAGDAVEAHRYTMKALNLNDDDPYGIFNIGVQRWYAAHGTNITVPTASSRVPSFSNAGDLDERWKKPLKRFLELTVSTPSAARPRAIAQAILAGEYKQKPPLIHPPEPVAAR